MVFCILFHRSRLMAIRHVWKCVLIITCNFAGSCNAHSEDASPLDESCAPVNSAYVNTRNLAIYGEDIFDVQPSGMLNLKQRFRVAPQGDFIMNAYEDKWRYFSRPQPLLFADDGRPKFADCRLISEDKSFSGMRSRYSLTYQVGVVPSEVTIDTVRNRLIKVFRGNPNSKGILEIFQYNFIVPLPRTIAPHTLYP
jgi:hypothetical protein